MKKQITQKVANKAYDKLLSGKKNLDTERRDWTYTTLYKPESCEISNRFFKNKVTRFTYKCKCDRCVKGKLASTRKRWESTQEQLNDYL